MNRGPSGDEAVCRRAKKKVVDARQATMAAIRDFVSATYTKMAGKAAKSKETAAAKKKAAKALEDARARWHADLAAKPLAVVTERAPWSCGVHEDTFNGRFRVSHPDFGRKSISWTERGDQAAAIKALEIMWGWHKTRTGELPPPELGLVL